MTSIPIIETKALKKYYSPRFTLGPINLSIQQSECLALIGKNGSGKSTLFQLLTGNIDATDGELFYSGSKLVPEQVELKRRIGYLPQDMFLPKWITGQEILAYAQGLHGITNQQFNLENFMQFWDCYEYRNLPLAACSYGMQKRVGLALATLHDPDCLILDEPFSGLDLFHIKALDEILKIRKTKKQMTILSTHVIPYITKLCDRVCILKAGQMSELEHWQSYDPSTQIQMVEAQFFSSQTP